MFSSNGNDILGPLSTLLLMMQYGPIHIPRLLWLTEHNPKQWKLWLYVIRMDGYHYVCQIARKLQDRLQ